MSVNEGLQGETNRMCRKKIKDGCDFGLISGHPSRDGSVIIKSVFAVERILNTDLCL